MHSSSTELSTIEEAEKLLLAQPQVGCVVTHFFGPGVYIRTVTVEKDVFITSHRHRFEHLNIVLAGAVSMRHEDEGDDQIRIVRAPYMYTAPPGRKIGLVLEKLVWLNVFATRETDVEALEAQLFDKSAAFTDLAAKVKAEQGAARAADREDFLTVLAEYGISAYDAKKASEREDDLTPMPEGWPIVIRQSAIEGRGLFVQTPMVTGSTIGPARIAGKRTPAGRYANHSRTPNAAFEVRGGSAYLVALAPIAPFCSETVPGDEVTVDYRQVGNLVGRLK